MLVRAPVPLRQETALDWQLWNDRDPWQPDENEGIKVRFLAGLTPSLLFALIPASASAQELHGLPTSMLGVWGSDEQSCLRLGDDGRVTIGEASLEFGVSAYQLLSIVMRPDGAVRGEGLYREEGYEDASTQIIELELLTPRQLLVRQAPGQQHVYVRCVAAG